MVNVLRTLDDFERDVMFDSVLRQRVIEHWARFPPMGLVIRFEAR